MKIDQKCKDENDIYTLTKKKFPKFQSIMCIQSSKAFIFLIAIKVCGKSNKIVSISKWMVVFAMSHNDNP